MSGVFSLSPNFPPSSPAFQIPSKDPFFTTPSNIAFLGLVSDQTHWSFSLCIFPLKVLIQSHHIIYHLFANECWIFTPCPKLSGASDLLVLLFIRPHMSRRFLKFSVFITKLIFFSKTWVCYIRYCTLLHPAWKLRGTVSLLFPSPFSIPLAQIPFFLEISQMYFPNISRSLPFSFFLGLALVSCQLLSSLACITGTATSPLQCYHHSVEGYF